MKSLKTPLNFSKDKFFEKVEEKEAVNSFVQLIIESQQGSFRPDYDFGFSLNNHQFVNIDNEIKMKDENSFTKTSIREELVKKNHHLFTRELEKTIKKFETRLNNEEDKDMVSVSIVNKQVVISVTGTLDNENYNNELKINIWS